MLLPIDLAPSLIGVLDEPSLIVDGGRTAAANESAKLLLGQSIEGAEVRFAVPTVAGEFKQLLQMANRRDKRAHACHTSATSASFDSRHRVVSASS